MSPAFLRSLRSVFIRAERWLTGQIDDEAAIEDLARRFSVLVDAWRAAKANHGAPLTA